jgi:hypothetical protein
MTRLTQAHTAQGGITLDLEQDELGEQILLLLGIGYADEGRSLVDGTGVCSPRILELFKTLSHRALLEL